MKPHMVGLRLYICASGLLSALQLHSNPRIFSDAEAGMRAFVVLLFVATCLIGALDTIINDILADRWQIKWAESGRHHGFVVLALANLAIIFVAISRDTASVHLARFGLDSIMCVFVAFRDVQLRFVEPRKESYAHADHPI